MEEINLRQIKEQIDLYVGEQLKQMKQKLIEILPKEVDWQLEEKIRQISREIWQKTVLGDNHQNWLDIDGYLINPEDWSIAVAEYFAREEGAGMTEKHWEIIHLLREYYEEHLFIPPIQMLVKIVRRKLGTDKGDKKYLYELFHVSPVAQATKIAGLPRPLGGCV